MTRLGAESRKVRKLRIPGQDGKYPKSARSGKVRIPKGAKFRKGAKYEIPWRRGEHGFRRNHGILERTGLAKGREDAEDLSKDLGEDLFGRIFGIHALKKLVQQ
jgi:hypothetical protein